MTLQELADKLEIQEVLARYARGVDTHDWDLWRSVFTADAYIDYREASSLDTAHGSRDAMGAWLEQGFASMPMSQHYVTNVEVDLDGDSAKVLALFWNPMRLAGTDDVTYCGGYYRHEMIRTDQGWKSRRLVEERVWFTHRPETAKILR